MKTIDDTLFDELLAPGPDPRMPVDLLPRILAIPSRSRVGLPRPAVVAASAVLVLLLAWFSAHPTRTTTDRVARLDPPTLAGRVLAAVTSSGSIPDDLCAELGETALVPLHRVASAEDPVTARRALGWIGRIASPRSLTVLAAAVEREDRQVEAVAALAELGPRAVPLLAPLLECDSAFDAALTGITTAGGPRVATVLARAAADREDGPRRRRLLAALAAVDGRDAVLRLIAFLANEDVGAEVLELLDTERDRMVPHLIALAEKDDAALRALALLAPPEAVPTLVRLIEDRDRRTLVARALARIDTPEATDALVARAGDPAIVASASFAGPGLEVALIHRLDNAQRREVADLVTLLGEAGGDASVATLVRLAEDPDPGPTAVAALARIGTPAAIRALSVLGKDDRLRRPAMAALGATGRPAAVATLVRLGREYRGVRRDACRALSHIPAATAVEGILLLSREGGIGREARRALSRMDGELVRTTLSRLVGGELKSQAKRALSDLGVPAGPPRAASLL